MVALPVEFNIPRAEVVKRQAAGQWQRILQNVCGLTAEQVRPGYRGPCPQCGGEDRFSPLKDVAETGGLWCRGCHNADSALKAGDGLAAVQWLLRVPFTEALRAVADELGGLPRASSPAKPAVGGKTIHLTMGTAVEAAGWNVQQTKKLPEKPKPANVWTYYNAAGAEVGAVVRWDLAAGKEIRQLRVEGGGWVVGGMHKPRPLYGLPLLAAADPMQPVFVVEGEKAADCGQALNLCCITSSQGGGSAEKTDWGPVQGRPVVIIPDNDEPGESYAADVARLCLAAGASSVGVLRLPTIWPDCPPKGDLADFSEAFDSQSADQLAAVLLSAAVEPVAADAVAESVPEAVRLFEIVDSAANDVPWESPVPFTPAALPEISAADLPAPLSRFVEELSASSETPAALGVMCVLGVLASSCQRKLRIQTDGEHCEQLSLYLLACAMPGERKSSVLKLVREPLSVWERMETKRLQPTISEAQSRRRAAESRIEHLQKKSSREDDILKRAGLLAELQQLEAELPEVPALPCLVTSDATTEALAPLMQRQCERMSVIADEGGQFEVLSGIYSKGVPKLDLVLQAYDGSEVRIVRAMGKDVHLRSPALTIVLSVQPAVLHQAIANPAFRGRGLVQRFLYALPEQRVGYRALPDRPALLSADAKAEWEAIVLALLNLPFELDQFEQPAVRTIRLDRNAFRVWKDFQREIEPLCRPGGRWHFETGWASKFPGAVARIAGVLHSALCVHDSIAPDVMLIPESTMKMAVSLGRKLEAHALRAFTSASTSETEKLAEKICRWLQERRVSTVRVRELLRGPCSGLRRDQINAALDLMAEHHWLRACPRTSGGGRPAQEFQVNPALPTIRGG